MSKGLALKDFVEFDHVDLSEFCRGVDPTDEHNEVDVSGFNATGTDEFLLGTTVQRVTCEMFDSTGSGEVHDTIYHLYRARTAFSFKWRRDQTLPTSATNPQLSGNVYARTYAPTASRGEVRIVSVELLAADETGLVWADT